MHPVNLLKVLATCVAIYAASTVHGMLNFTISPIEGDDEHFLFSASGTAEPSSYTTSLGQFNFNGGTMPTNRIYPIEGLYYGGYEIAQIQFNYGSFFMYMNDNLPSGSAYTFTGGPISIAFQGSDSFENLFVPGEFDSTLSNTLFNNSTGHLSVRSEPIPEPGVYALLVGIALLGMTLWRRRIGK